MALSDCEKCWDTPCECGYQYKDWSDVRLLKFIEVLQKLYYTRQREKMSNALEIVEGRNEEGKV